jgi:hypothetical protein
MRGRGAIEAFPAVHHTKMRLFAETGDEKVNRLQETYTDPHALMRSFVTGVIYKTFAQATRHIGLPEFPRPTFLREILPYLENTDGVFHESRRALMKLWNSIQHGEVIATDVRDDAPVFYVRGGVGQTGVVVRLAFAEQEWHIDSVVSVYDRPLTRSPWFNRTLFAAAVIVAAILGFAAHRPAAVPVATQPAVRPGAGGATAGSRAESSAKSRFPSTHAKNSDTHGKPPAGHAVARTLSFTLAQGMPLFNLARFLYEHHLVKNAMVFDLQMTSAGIDRTMQPGRYVFREGMSVAQILQVLRNGPAA